MKRSSKKEPTWSDIKGRLTVFYCESCMNLHRSCGMDDESYFDALLRMFEQAMKAIRVLDPSRRKAFVERIEQHKRHPEWFSGCLFHFW